MPAQPTTQSDSPSNDGAAARATWPPDLTVDRSLAGARIGANYQLLEQIGAGGMGVVYRAQQDHPVQRLVAIKLIKLGIDTPQIVARFQSERQALAVLEHPGISRVYDAGTTDTGRPYFVMEYVAGRPITEYCDQKRLTTNRRLELFAQVCQAVQHAHYNGILHRDLKPSNMLVTEIDGAPQVKIIDFGIAKAIRGATASPFATDAGQFVGTPVYTSPEQAAGEDVDTRADIYSLGVVLYELLSGALPFDVPATANSAAIARQITTVEPPRPSTRLSALGETATTLASLRGAADAATLRRQLRGDLDLIVMKAMHRDRSQRYDSAAALAEDVRRYLAHEPILARPPTLAYEARKFARRNRVFVSAAAIVMLAVVAGALSAGIGLWRAKQALAREAKARQDEQAQRQVAENVSQFLSNMLSSVQRDKAKGKEVLVREVLDRAAADLPAQFAKQPLVAATLHNVIADTYLSLGLDEVALTHAQTSLDQRTATLGADHPDTLDATQMVATILGSLGREMEAEPILRDLVARRARVHGPDADLTLKAEDNLALILQHVGRAAEAEPLQRHVLETRLREVGPEHHATLHTMHNMAPILEKLGKIEEAEEMTRKVAEVRMRELGADHPDTLLSQSNYATTLLKQRKYSEAEPILRDVLERNSRVSGPNHPDTLATLNNLANALDSLGRRDEAIEMFHDLVARVKVALPENHPNVFVAIANLAQNLEQVGRNDEALVYYKEMYDRAPASNMPPGYVAQYMTEYALKLAQFGHIDKAEGPLLEARRRLEGANLTKGQKIRSVLTALGDVYQKTNRPEEAAKCWQEVERLTALAATMPAAAGKPAGR